MSNQNPGLKSIYFRFVGEFPTLNPVNCLGKDYPLMITQNIFPKC